MQYIICIRERNDEKTINHFIFSHVRDGSVHDICERTECAGSAGIIHHIR